MPIGRKRRAGGTATRPPAKGASAWDWLIYVNPLYASKLTTSARQKLQETPATTVPGLSEQVWAASRGRDVSNTGMYEPGSPIEKEHIYMGPGIESDPKRWATDWAHESTHALERLSRTHVGNLWKSFSPEMQQEVLNWYGDKSPLVEIGPEAFVWLIQNAGFNPWDIPKEYQSHFQNLYQAPLFEQPQGYTGIAASSPPPTPRAAQLAPISTNIPGISAPAVSFAVAPGIKRYSPQKVGRKFVR